MKLMRILHVYRNTPLGRETLLGAAYLCRRTGMQLAVHIPREERFTLNFDRDLVEVQLDSSYLISPETAELHARELVEAQGLALRLVEPSHRVASTLPELPSSFDMMTCPRSLSESSETILPGLLGSRVRRLVRAATFPVMILPVPAMEWDRVITFFGGSPFSLNALAWGRTLARSAGVPFELITVNEERALSRARTALAEAGLMEELERSWRIVDGAPFVEALWEVPRTALVTAGAFGHSGIKATMFGSRTEIIQSHLPNPLLLAGPRAGVPEP